MKKLVVVVAAVVLALYLWNASWLVPASGRRPVLLAHRGVHQTFEHEGVDMKTCTASRIRPPTHALIENTLASMRAAFDAGASYVELDVQPTSDGTFVVFHDWTLECRTDGKGVTREQPLAYLKSLDLGYGYTSDGGKTFPLRGRGVGLMPTLAEVLEAFPTGRLVLNLKSRDPREGDALAAFLRGRPTGRLVVYGDEAPVDRVRALIPTLRGFSKRSLKDCFKRYMLLGWTGDVPAACRDTVIVLPASIARHAWGWPRRFTTRLREHGTDFFVAGDDGSSGIDDLEALAALGDGYDGGVWTNRVELLGPAVQAR